MIRPCLLSILMSCFLSPATIVAAQPLEPVKVSDDGSHFVGALSGHRFVVWGVNYDHDASGRLLDEYWIDEWETVVEDFREIKALGVNCVRIHLQVGKFMTSPSEPDSTSLDQLARLVKLAEDTGLYLDVTGLACYHKANIPPWYDQLSEQNRWAVQQTGRALCGTMDGWVACAKPCEWSVFLLRIQPGSQQENT